MSHSASATFSFVKCYKEEKKIMQGEYDKFVKLIENATGPFSEKIEDLLKQLKKQIKIIENMEGEETVIGYDYESEELAAKRAQNEAEELLARYKYRVDSILKKLNFIDSTLNYNEEMGERISSHNKYITELIANNGNISLLAITELEENNIEISKENLENKISEIRNIKFESEKLDEFKEMVSNSILRLDLPVTFIKKLHKDLDDSDTIQEINDVQAMAKSISLSKKRTTKVLNDLIEVSKLQNIKVSKPKSVVYNGSPSVSMKSVDSEGGNIEYLIDLQRETINYKMGDYEGHVCFDTSEKILQMLRERGNVQTDFKLVRDYSNARPLEKTAMQRINSTDNRREK